MLRPSLLLLFFQYLLKLNFKSAHHKKTTINYIKKGPAKILHQICTAPSKPTGPGADTQHHSLISNFRGVKRNLERTEAALNGLRVCSEFYTVHFILSVSKCKNKLNETYSRFYHLVATAMFRTGSTSPAAIAKAARRNSEEVLRMNTLYSFTHQREDRGFRFCLCHRFFTQLDAYLPAACRVSVSEHQLWVQVLFPPITNKQRSDRMFLFLTVTLSFNSLCIFSNRGSAATDLCSLKRELKAFSCGLLTCDLTHLKSLLHLFGPIVFTP